MDKVADELNAPELAIILILTIIVLIICLCTFICLLQ